MEGVSVGAVASYTFTGGVANHTIAASFAIDTYTITASAGANGAMTGGGYPDGIRQIMDPYFAGRREEAASAYARWLPLINYENRQCGLQACKILMKEGGVIGSEAVRHPLQKVHPATRAGLIEIARRLDPVVLRWGR